jgi:hypothetical protein
LNSKVFPSCWRRISARSNTLGNMPGSASSNQASVFILRLAWDTSSFSRLRSRLSNSLGKVIAITQIA